MELNLMEAIKRKDDFIINLYGFIRLIQGVLFMKVIININIDFIIIDIIIFILIMLIIKRFIN
jgi:hypothetical protein